MRALIPTAPHPQLGERALAELERLARALELETLLSDARSLLACLSQSWATESLRDGPQWASELTDDAAPYEWSVALEPAGAKLRLLLEAQCRGGNLCTRWVEASRLQGRLAHQYGLSEDRFNAVADLFRPWRADGARFALWHAVVM